ncbi:ribonuclease III, partial [Listeria monocytogenes]|nr:ribonuclease III [Listeria monocytogenes]
MNQWEELQESVGFDFKDVELLKQAFTHSSY